MIETRQEQIKKTTSNPSTPSKSYTGVCTPKMPIQEVQLVTRPISITICALLLFLSALIVAVLVLGNSTHLAALPKMVGPLVLYFSIAYTIVCGIGYWNMKRWAVVLYGLDVAARFFLGFPTSLIAIPALIVAFGIINFDEMTWK